MNITSVVVAASLMGIAAPGVANMAIQPMIAQKRASNFGEAESLAVTFAASNEGQREVAEEVPEDCDLVSPSSRAYTITCEIGEGQFLQTASRSFRLEVESTYSNPDRAFAWTTPPKYSHVECLSSDPWGVMWYNAHLAAGGLGQCIPAAAWNENRYFASNPDDWLWDLSDHGYGTHPDY
jgi:hypothetical protein